MRWRTMQTRIASTFIGLLVITLVFLSLVLVQVFRTSYLETLQTGLAGQATLIAASAARMEDDLVPRMPFDTMVLALQPDPTIRVTFIADDGSVLADTHLPVDDVIGAAERPEVQAALRGERGLDRRFVSATGENMLFVAIPVTTTSQLQVVRVGVPLTTIARAEARMGTTVLVTALIAAIFAIGLAMLSARQITAPLLTLRAMANRLAMGEVDVAMPIPQEETLADVARDFNAMATQVRRLIESREAERQRLSTVLMTMGDGMMLVNLQDQVVLLNPAAENLLQLSEPELPLPLQDVPLGETLRLQVQATRGVVESQHLHISDITLEVPLRFLRVSSIGLPTPDHDHVLVVLHDLTDLRQAEYVRRTVLTNITHDLRTPLTSLQAMIETLQDGALDDPPAAQDFLQRMDAEVQHLHHLVSDVLDLARLEAGATDLDRQPIVLGDLLETVVQRMSIQAAQQGVDLAIQLPHRSLLLALDAHRMEQVMLNLLGNALRFTPAGGEIQVSLVVEATRVLIEVRDTGTGIALADLPHIFERFYKADQARRHGGAGVGLSIVQAIIQQHGGTVAVSSRIPGGTTMTIALPLLPVRTASLA